MERLEIWEYYSFLHQSRRLWVTINNSVSYSLGTFGRFKNNLLKELKTKNSIDKYLESLKPGASYITAERSSTISNIIFYDAEKSRYSLENLVHILSDMRIKAYADGRGDVIDILMELENFIIRNYEHITIQ